MEFKAGADRTIVVSLIAAPVKAAPAPATPVADEPDAEVSVPWTVWAVAGLSVAALTFGGVNIILASDDAEKARHESTLGTEGSTQEWESYKHRAEQRLLFANTGFILGGVGVFGTGLLLFLANPSE